MEIVNKVMTLVFGKAVDYDSFQKFLIGWKKCSF